MTIPLHPLRRGAQGPPGEGQKQEGGKMDYGELYLLREVEKAARMVVIFACGRDKCPFCNGASYHIGKCPLLDLDRALIDYTDMEDLK